MDPAEARHFSRTLTANLHSFSNWFWPLKPSRTLQAPAVLWVCLNGRTASVTSSAYAETFGRKRSTSTIPRWIWLSISKHKDQGYREEEISSSPVASIVWIRKASNVYHLPVLLQLWIEIDGWSIWGILAQSLQNSRQKSMVHSIKGFELN